MNSLEYNTERKKLIIPEYGRHVHQMVDQAVLVKDKEERNKMAKAIIGVMGNLNPHLRDVPDFQHKLWAQLFIMSDFQLDVDSPFEKPSEDIYKNSMPNKLNYPQSHHKSRFYGNNIKKMIDIAIFPGLQGGPLMHIIAAKAVAFGEALRPEFKSYAGQIILNAKNFYKKCGFLEEGKIFQRVGIDHIRMSLTL